MDVLCLPALVWWSFIVVAVVNGCCLICLLITGAQRMRSAMGGNGEQRKTEDQKQTDKATPGTSTDPDTLPVGDKIENGGSIVQVKSRENTVDFSEDVQTILDTGEIKLVKAMQKTTETQTDFMPVWFFGFDPNVNQTPPEGGEGAAAMQPASHDVPAVDLSKFEQFSVVHYSDTRDPDNRKLVMIQTPGSKMYKPEELCSENLLVQNRPSLDAPSGGRRQIFEHRKAKSLDNSALMRRNHSSDKQPHNERELRRQERVTVEAKMEADVDEASHEGDASLQDHDIDSGIWDMVHGRDTRLSTREVTSPLMCAASSSVTKDQEEEEEEDGDEMGQEQEVPDSEDTAKWQEMFDQLATTDSDRPTMSYRVFHIQDQVTVDSESAPDSACVASPEPSPSSPLSASTPRPHRILEEEVEEAPLEDDVLDGGLGSAAGGSVLSEETFTDDSLSGSMTEPAEDSGWLFDKIPAMQGSLIHSPTTPGSPKVLDNEREEDAEEEDITPTKVVEETISVEYCTRVEGSCVVEPDVPGQMDSSESIKENRMRYNRDSLESTDTVTQDEDEGNLNGKGQEGNKESPVVEHIHDRTIDAQLEGDEDVPVTAELTSPLGSELFDEQEAFAAQIEAVESEIQTSITQEKIEAGESPSPSTGTLEEATVINASRTTSLTSNGDVYESCEEGPFEDSLLTCDTAKVSPGLPLGNNIHDMNDPSRNAASGASFGRKVPVPVQIPAAHYSPLQSPLSKPTSPLARTFSASGSGNLPERGCVVHRSGARPKMSVLSPQRRGHNLGLQSILNEESSTVINGQSPDRRSSWGTSGDVYLLNRDGTLTNANTINSGVVYRSGARPKSTSLTGSSHGGRADHGLSGLNSLMVRSTSSTVVHSHVVTEMTAARARLNIPELRRTPDRHSVASSDSEYASVDSSLATSPTSTSVEELASVGSDTCLLAEVMPVAMYPDWMANLPKRLHAVPLTQLAIPGSNISFGIESDMRTDMSFSKCNLEMAEFLRKLPPLAVFDNFRRVMKDIWRAWMPKQILSIAKQLEAGVRYLDIHITKYRGTFHGEHGLYTRSLKHYLRKVEEFIQTHPREVIILHFQKFINLTPKDKRSLVTLLFQFFGAKLCRVMDIENLTLEELWGSRKQIIAIFPDADMAALSNHIFAGLIWSNKMMRVSLPRKPTTEELLTYLESIYDEHREPNQFHVLQAVVSPDMNMVFGDYDHKSMRSLTLHEVSPYLKVWIPGKYKLNIVAVDFVGIYDITGEIIRLNVEKKAETIV